MLYEKLYTLYKPLYNNLKDFYRNNASFVFMRINKDLPDSEDIKEINKKESEGFGPENGRYRVGKLL